MPFTPDPNKQARINTLTKLLETNGYQYDITLVTDHTVLLNIEVMPPSYVEAEEETNE
tara:strand:- start:744 stop:917 length:174 start_codon:yes stop_codon:yes gene_type:complete